MQKLLFAFIFILLSASTIAQDCVVLLHGMARSHRSTYKMEEALKTDGYEVINFDYPSTKHNIATLAKDYLPKAINQCRPNTTIHFVTHSLGGIVLRQYLSNGLYNNKLEKLGRVVMLGPPNKGSQVVDTLRDVPGYLWLNGPAGLQLGTDRNSVPNSLGAVTYPVGIIAGNSSINLILSQMLPSRNDGKVSVENTKVEGMTDHLVVPVSHPFLMRNNEVILQVKAFLKTGKFLRNEDQASLKK
jgi:hypothetical protein